MFLLFRPSSAPPSAAVPMAAAARATSSPAPPPLRPSGPPSPGTLEAIAKDLEEPESDDTMNNLRKTFAGIFGSMTS